MKYKPHMNHLQWITLSRSLITTHFLNVIYYKQFNNRVLSLSEWKNVSFISRYQIAQNWEVFFCFAEAQKHSMVSVLDCVLTSFLIANELVEIWLIINDD